MRPRLTRDFYIPKVAGTQKVKLIDSQAVVYIYERAGTPFAVGFRSDRVQKPDFQYRWNDGPKQTAFEKREAFVKRFFENIKEREASKVERRQKRKDADRGLNVGDIIYCSWGYDQTNIDFYQVVGLKGKYTVRLRKIGKVVTESKGWMSDMVVAQKDNFVSDEILNRRARNGSVRVDSVRYGSKWDGQPRNETSYH